MCIALCSPEGVVVPKQHLEESFKRNPDGAGFAYAEFDRWARCDIEEALKPTTLNEFLTTVNTLLKRKAGT